ncbi:alpha/beta fold hydrolase [Streptomyces sp. NPDC005202]|uniref:alpha/beta fold hydrolase n=1 Tax=Streptomyces sp. NPDC005202 TaxID=3157021 RepID=UPI0033B92755
MVDVPRRRPARAARLRPVGDGELQLQYRVVHGYRRAFRMAGEGPVLILIHGIGDSSATWAGLVPDLARTHTVIAPDLLGHGASDKPRADYSVAAYVNGVRDLLTTLGVESATLVGHSLGGGVAMQFAYRFPERTERLVLLGAGGVGREANPGAAAGLPPRRAPDAVHAPSARDVAPSGPRGTSDEAAGHGLGRDAPELLTLVDALPDEISRSAFIRTLRALVDWRGQVVTMLDPLLPHRGHAHDAAVGRPGQCGAGAARPPCARGDAGQSAGDLPGRGPLPVPHGPRPLRGPDRGLHRHHRPRRLEPRPLAARPAPHRRP